MCGADRRARQNTCLQPSSLPGQNMIYQIAFFRGRAFHSPLSVSKGRSYSRSASASCYWRPVRAAAPVNNRRERHNCSSVAFCRRVFYFWPTPGEGRSLLFSVDSFYLYRRPTAVTALGPNSRVRARSSISQVPVCSNKLTRTQQINCYLLI